jgi:hypothetical protein
MHRFLFAAAVCLLSGDAGRADEKTEKIEAQKKQAQANWEKVEAGPAAVHETANLLLFGPKALEKKLEAHGATLEKHFKAARDVLFDAKDTPIPGKLTVYLFETDGHFKAFLRRVEKRRLDGDEQGSYMADDDELHVAACPPVAKTDPPLEIQAGQQIGALLMQRKAGVRTILPHWLTFGFGRATFYRALPADPAVTRERRLAAQFASKNKRNAHDVWGELRGEEYNVLSASVADFLGYNSRSKFLSLLEAFKPGENMDSKTTAQALEAAMLSVDRLDKNWRDWVSNPK